MKSVKWIFALIVASLLLSVGSPVVEVTADGGNLVVVKGNTQGSIDGAATPADAYSSPIMLSNSKGSFQVQTYRDPGGLLEEEIQFLFVIDDGTSNAGDEIKIFFDIDHDHIVTTTEPDRGIWIRRIAGSVVITDANLFGTPTTLSSVPPAQLNINSLSGSTWTAEVKLKASDLDLNFIPSLMGMVAQVTDVPNTGSTTTGNYPTAAILATPSSWANLKTRKPLEYALVLDASGSMLRDFDGNHPTVTTERWQAAKAASDIFTQIFYAFRSGDDAGGTPYFEDKIGLATYYWLDGATPEDKSDEVKNLDLLNVITVDGYVDSSPTPAAPVFGQHTPIKRGVDVGLEMFENADAEKIIILLSDGIHDRPTSDYNYETYDFPLGTSFGDYQVNTVALGPDSSVGTQLLDDIKDEFGGFGGSYVSALQKQELTNAFVENLFSQLYLNRVSVNASGEFPVNDREPRLLVMLVWHSVTAGDRGFRILRPDNTVIDITDPSYHHFKNTALGYELAYYLLDFPSPTGTWQTIQLGSMTAQVGDNNFALFDPTVYGFFTVDQSGSDFILKAVLKENGVPITEPAGSIIANVTKPDQGFGSFASTIQLNCEFVPPQVEKAVEYSASGWLWRRFVGFFSNLISSFRKVTTEQSITSSRLLEIKTELQPEVRASALPSAEGTPVVEPLPAHYAKVQELLQRCEIDGLKRSSLTVELRDDGSNADEVANDGIFTYRFDDTKYEGTYTFDFTASGAAPSGSGFSRVRTLSAHKSVVVLPDLTKFLYTQLFQEGPYVYTEYFVIPTDLNGEYLGPGRLNQIEFSATAGEWQTEIIDRNDGVYSRVLRYNIAEGEPFVTPVVQGNSIEEPWGVFFSLISLLILVIILLLIYVLRFRRQRAR